MPIDSTLATCNDGTVGGVTGAAIASVLPAGRDTPLDCAPTVAAAFGGGTTVPVRNTLWPTYDLTDVPDSW
jgi:hypothetical protein